MNDLYIKFLFYESAVQLGMTVAIFIILCLKK